MSINSTVPVDQVILATISGVYPLAYVSIFWFIKNECRSPRSSGLEHLLDTYHSIGTDCRFRVIYKIPSKYSVNTRLRLSCIAEALAIRTFKPDLCCTMYLTIASNPILYIFCFIYYNCILTSILLITLYNKSNQAIFVSHLVNAPPFTMSSCLIKLCNRLNFRNFSLMINTPSSQTSNS